MKIPEKLDDRYLKVLKKLTKVTLEKKIEDKQSVNYLCHMMLAYKLSGYVFITSIGLEYLIKNNHINE